MTVQVLVTDLVILGLYPIDNDYINCMIYELQQLKNESRYCKNEFDLLEGTQEYNNKLNVENKNMELRKLAK